MGGTSSGLLTDLLKQVSRTFYKTMRVLPAAIRPQISLAYLLARTTDTIADTQIVSPAGRLDALRALRDRILGHSTAPLQFGELARSQTSAAEWALLQRSEESLALLGQFSLEDQVRIREVLVTIISGQELDLNRFAGASGERIVSLNTDEELDDYTYRVAGCVGEFWTRLCRAHLFPGAALDDQRLLADSVRFGKGLQLVNILRDLPQDLRQGRCYLPADKLSASGLNPASLLEPETERPFRQVYDGYLALARAHLAAGWDYTNGLPRSCARVRLACAWPILIGVRTLARLETQTVLDAGLRIKISRTEVRSLVVRSVLYYPWPGRWRGLFAEATAGRKDRT